MSNNFTLISYEKNNINNAGNVHKSQPILERFVMYIENVIKPVKIDTPIKSNLWIFFST